MKIGIVLNTDNAETAWNALRFGITALKNRHKVKLFLLGSGVDLPRIRSRKFDIDKKISEFKESGGAILACGSCLEIRGRKDGFCPVSTMKELLTIVEESDKVLSFS